MTTGTPTVSYSPASGIQSFRLVWQPTRGCADIISTYEFCFSVMYGRERTTSDHCEDYQVHYFRTNERSSVITLTGDLAGWRAVKLVSAKITPQNRVYPLWASNYPVVSYRDARWVYRGGGTGD